MDETTLIRVSCKGVDLELETAPGMFAAGGFDRGTQAMLSVVEFEPDDRILDLGCGYGPVGILAAKLIGPENVVMSDINPQAVELSRRNAKRNDVGDIAIYESDAYRGHREAGFTKILSNPPYHAEFAVPKEFIQKGFNRLKIGGKMYMVTRRRAWYEKKLASIFGGVKVHEIDGYFVFEAEKRRPTYARRK